MKNQSLETKGIIKRELKKVRLYSKLFIFSIFFLGIITTVGFNQAVVYTNSEAFCISCHEMNATVYQEYLESPHDVNPSGVRATCGDCHVPHEFGPLVAKKIMAAKDVYHWMLGTIDNEEKFEAHRLKMAQTVWTYMEESNSRECRSCHQESAMDLAYQDKSARKKHELANEKGMTCIDCHKGIAHELPDMEDVASEPEKHLQKNAGFVISSNSSE